MNKMKVGILSALTGIALSVQAFEPWTIDLVDELAALNAIEGHPNPWTSSVQDGQWGFYGRDPADSVDEAWSPFVETDAGLVGFYDENRLYCAFLANPTDSTQPAPSFIGGSIDSRKVFYHPRSYKSVETLRFVVKSTGLYSIAGTVRKIPNAGNGITLGLFVNGRAITNLTSTVDIQAFGGSNLLLWPDDLIELRLTSNGNLASDATELTYVLTKSADDAAITLPLEMDAISGLERSVRTDPPVNPCVVSNYPCSWSFLQRSGTAETLLTERTSEVVSGTTYYGLKAASLTYPTLFANSSAVAYVPGGAVKSVDPGEMFFTPSASASGETVFRCTVECPGIYSYSVRARGVGYGSGNGVNVAVFRVEGSKTAERLDGALLEPGGDVGFSGERLFLSKGDRIELVLDANGSNAYDGTAVRFSLQADTLGLAKYDAADAMRENVNADYPAYENFVDSQGGKWSYGSLNPSGWVFSPVTSEKVQGDFRGWQASGGYPYLCVNKKFEDATLEAAVTHPYEVAVHPGSPSSADIRFFAPQDGIYILRGQVRALNTYASGNGVEGRVVLRGAAFVTNATVCGHATGGLPSSFRFLVQDLWMKAGETLDLAVGPNGAYAYDASTMSAEILSNAAVPTGLLASFDICGRERAPYAGAGRVGYSSDGGWQAIRPGSRRSSVGPLVGGCRRAVRMELSKAAGSMAIADVPALVSDGVVSQGPADPVTFTVRGLTPNADYSFCAYSRNASGVCGVFTVGATVVAATETWFCPSGGDLCRFSARADEKGEITGTFAGTADGAATFCGLQVYGEDFPVYEPNGFMMILR